MRDTAHTVLTRRVQMTHGMILRITRELTDAQLAWRPSDTGPPPIGWHLWHVSRWADRLQTSISGAGHGATEDTGSKRGIWEGEKLVSQWGLNPEDLGLLETGVLMDRGRASVVAGVGRDRLLDYARRTCSAVDRSLSELDPDRFGESRESIMELEIVGNTTVPARGADTTLAGDIGFHLAHANRHLGMMEILSGLQGLRGSATI